MGVSRWLPAGRLSIPDSYVVEGEPLLVGVDRSPASPIILVLKGSDGKFHLSARTLSRGKGLLTAGDLVFESGAEPNALVLLDASD